MGKVAEDCKKQYQTRTKSLNQCFHVYTETITPCPVGLRKTLTGDSALLYQASMPL